MRKEILHKISFAGKSLLWSILLYLLSMAIINWDDMVRSIRNNNDHEVAIIHTVPAKGEPDAQSSIQKDIATGSRIFSLMKALLPIQASLHHLKAE